MDLKEALYSRRAVRMYEAVAVDETTIQSHHRCSHSGTECHQ